MKPRNILSIAILPLLMLSLQHCDDPLTELEKLPPPTQSGKRTFGCLVDGKAAHNQGISTASDYQGGTFFIHAGLGSGLVQITINDSNLSEKTYQLTERVVNGTHARYYDGTCNFYTSNLNTGTVTITHLDKVNFIISGTFEFTVYSDDCTKSVVVTEGRFDDHYAP
jgi:hypothetical protein